MDNTQKIGKVLNAFDQLAAEYRAEGRPAMAEDMAKALTGFPVESLVRIYDILMKDET